MMPNPILPSYEYIPDGESRVFGDRVYLYGSHDNAGSDIFCDYKYYVWSAPSDDLDNWRNEGISFSTRTVDGHKADVDWDDENDGQLIGVLDMEGTSSDNWDTILTKVKNVNGTRALYFKFISSEDDVIAEIESFQFK